MNGGEWFGLHLPANTSAAHLDGDLAGVQALATLNILQLGSRLRNPQVMLGVGVHTDVGLGDVRSGRHGLRLKRKDERGMAKSRNSGALILRICVPGDPQPSLRAVIQTGVEKWSGGAAI